MPLDKLLESVALGARDSDTLTTLASRLARLDRQIEGDARHQIAEVSGGVSLRDMIQNLFEATNPDEQPEDGQPLILTESTEEYLTPELIRERMDQLVTEACKPFDNPELRNTLVELRRQHEQTIDIVSQDSVISSEFDEAAKERAERLVNGFKQFIEDNRDELTAIQLIYSRPYGQRHLTHQQVKELADAIERPPYQLTQEKLWQAYQQLEQSKVKGAGAKKLLTDIISLVRFAIEETQTLEPYRESVNLRFRGWLANQERQYSEEQMAWLEMIKDHIATSLNIEMEDFAEIPFQAKGGAIRVHQLFGEELTEILAELNERLAA